jgi:glycosyltransferase involved in cell wall biosynthesis/GT2 family glycosyltransferase
MGLRFETAQTHSAAIETERDLLVATARNLQQDAAYIRQALGGVVSSPGWQAILKYRRWLWATYSTSRIIRDWYEPLARSIVQKLLTAGAPYNPELIPRLELATPALVPPLPRQDLAYERWIELAEPGPRQLALESRMAAQFSYRPKISVAVPVYKVSLEILRQMVDSVRRQTYDNWELCIAHGDPDDAPARSYLAGAAKEEGRIKVEFLSSNAGISKNSDSALNLCSGEFVALLDHDDTLAPFALFEVAQVLNDNPALDFIYSDKDQLSEDGLLRMDPLFKPQWSPDVMLSANYLTHLCVMRTTEIQTLSGWRSETDGAQDWDLFLRITERTSRIAHIPKVLYHWRRVASSVASGGLGAKPYAAKGQLRAIQDHLDRRGMAAGAAFTPSGLLRLQWRGARPSVSIIVVGSGIEGLSFYDSLQGMENGSPEVWIVPIGDTPVPIPPTRRFKILAGGGSASLAERLNLAARQCTGEVLIFLDSAVEPSGDDWVDELAYPLLDRGIGVVGAKLFDPQSSSIRHAGIAFDPEGALSHPFAGEHDYVWSQFGGANWYRNWTAVSGACFSTRREVFLQAGGFADRPQYPRLDVDFCLNVILTLNLRILYNPFARMWQGRLAALEQWRSADETAGPRCFLQNFPDGDPYFNPNVSCASGSISLRLPQRSTQGLDHNFSGEARDLVRIFDYTPADVQASSRPRGSRSGHSEHRFTWFIPQFGNPFYGGVHTILRFADYFQRAHRVRSTFVVLGHRRPARVAAQIARVSEGLAQTSNIRVISEYGALDTLEPSDASMATLWTTAYYLLRYNNTGRKFYFLQDYEPLFYPAGSTGALVESTYRFGFYGICNTAPLRDLYMHHGGKADFFEPCVDQSVFFEPLRHRAPDPYVLFCYARPGHSRNCFELLAEGLRKLKHRMGDKIAIITAGETWIPALFELDGIVHNLGLLDYRTTGAVYRMSHAGISMMMTRHPSYLPLELMASGSLVITNRNEHTQWLLHDRDNCLLTETSSSAIAEAVEEGLRNQALRDRITRNASEMIQRKYQNWDEQAEKVYQSIAGML